MNPEIALILASGMGAAYAALRLSRARLASPSPIGTVVRVQTILPGVRLAELSVNGDRLVLAVTAGAVSVIGRKRERLTDGEDAT